jgi:hypothetical protein
MVLRGKCFRNGTTTGIIALAIRGVHECGLAGMDISKAFHHMSKSTKLVMQHTIRLMNHGWRMSAPSSHADQIGGRIAGDSFA